MGDRILVCDGCHCTDGRFLGNAEGERSEEHTSELQSRQYLVCRLLLEKKKNERVDLFEHPNLEQYTAHVNVCSTINDARTNTCIMSDSFECVRYVACSINAWIVFRIER